MFISKRSNIFNVRFAENIIFRIFWRLLDRNIILIIIVITTKPYTIDEHHNALSKNNFQQKNICFKII